MPETPTKGFWFGGQSYIAQTVYGYAVYKSRGYDGTIATLAIETTQMSVVFFVFVDFRKVGEFAAFIERPKAKSVSALGGGLLPSLTP